MTATLKRDDGSVEPTPRLLTGRDRAILAAVAAGRAEISCSSEPDLFIDGLSCCDQPTAHQLANAGLIAAAAPGQPGARVTAVLTAAGAATLASTGGASGTTTQRQPQGY